MNKEPKNKLSIQDPKLEGKWVAISNAKNEVIGYGEKLVPLSKEYGLEGVTYTKVPQKGVIYAF